MIFGERVKQARQLCPMTQADLSARLGVSQSTIAHVEHGRLSPSQELINAIALQTGFPPSFFRQPPDEDVPLGSLLFRARASASSQVENLAYRYAQMGYRLVRKLLERTKRNPLQLPRLDNEIPASAAERTRAGLGLPPDRPIERLTNCLERAGVVVFSLPIVLPKIDAFSIWADETTPMIILSYVHGGDGSRLRYSVAHEVGHLVMHRSFSGDVQALENEANAFAGELLLPEIAIREEVSPPVSLSALAALKNKWGVSIQAIIMRAYELEIITERQKKYLFQQLSAKGWRTREPRNLDVSVERPQTLPFLAQLHYGSPIDYAKLGSHTNLRSGFVEDFMNAQNGFLDDRQPRKRTGLAG